MKWIRRISALIAVLLCVLAGAVYWTALKGDRPVGFHAQQATDAGGAPFIVAVWYPTEARAWPKMLGPVLMMVADGGSIAGRDLPLVVISHGNGGGPSNHADLALALASAGYVVAAPMHAGDNYADQSAAGSASLFSDRNRQLRATVDYLLKQWPGHASINPDRIGAFGFSAGGTTVLTAVGAQPDPKLIARHCAEQPEFVCEVLKHAKSPLVTASSAQQNDAFLPDSRIKSAVLAAPGLGFAMVPNGLSEVHVALQLWSGDSDDKVPYASNAGLIRQSLGADVEFHAVPGAAHLSFLAPCGLLRPPGLCDDPAQFDRKAFHLKMNASILAFFDKTLPATTTRTAGVIGQ